MQKTRVTFVIGKGIEGLVSRYCYGQGFTKSGLFRKMILEFICSNREEFVKYVGSEAELNSLCNPR